MRTCSDLLYCNVILMHLSFTGVVERCVSKASLHFMLKNQKPHEIHMICIPCVSSLTMCIYQKKTKNKKQTFFADVSTAPWFSKDHNNCT